MKALLISATDTNAGKTVLTAALAAYLQTYRSSESVGILKPIQTGVGDRELYSQLFALNQSLDEITPLHFQAPLAPPVAAEREGRWVDLKRAWQTMINLGKQRDWVLVEAVGGLGTPLTQELTVADLARDWALPTVLVVPVRLGCLGQVVANVALARQSKVNLKGIVLNCVTACSDDDIADLAPIDSIQSLTNTLVLGIIPHLDNPTDIAKLAQVASNLDLEHIMPF
ncbi:dethiobiotin synthase [Argonema antarcticum]|uniref:dethiobiotin synthase n=1 Tax=Argonema antarcticum TaxID=2942763 RepID=UPI0020138BB7|nr:dethiobiotin synthase [Argonema antarcticum]MCL1472231.1 dethiobiotin synthase [Argonema antarcticum A004/B2]